MTNKKVDITRYAAGQSGWPTDDKNIKKLVPIVWCSTRKKIKGGLRLTDEGFELLSKTITFHRIRFDSEVDYTSQLLIRLDNYIDCPWYINRSEMYVTDDHLAIQLVLFSGNIAKFTSAKAESIKKSLTSS